MKSCRDLSTYPHFYPQFVHDIRLTYNNCRYILYTRVEGISLSARNNKNQMHEYKPEGPYSRERRLKRQARRQQLTALWSRIQTPAIIILLIAIVLLVGSMEFNILTATV